MKIPDMGKFLKDNLQYSFDELAISKLYYAKTINNKVLRTDFLYIVTTFDKKKHLFLKSLMMVQILHQKRYHKMIL